MDLDIFYFDKQTREKVLQMFDKTETEVNEDVRIIRDWIKSQPHLPETMEDVKISNFLIRNKFSIEKTKNKIDLYYTIRSLIPDLYEDINPKNPKIEQVLEISYICPYPKLIDGLYRAYLFKVKKINQIDVVAVVKYWINTVEVRLYEDCMAGEMIIADLTNITLSDLKKVTPIIGIKTLKVYEMLSIRMKAIHLLNSPPYVSVLIKVLKAVMKPKLFERVHVHRDAEILNEIFTKNDLPKDYGGYGPSLQDLNDLTQKKFRQYQERYDKLDSLRVDESLRPKKLNNDEFLGFYGSFKKLSID